MDRDDLSVRLRAKGPKGGALPPLLQQQQDHPVGHSTGARTHSAPEGVGRPTGQEDPNGGGGAAESAVLLALNKARAGQQDRNKRLSETEKNLFNSPFAQPLLKITEGKTAGGSPGH